MLYYCYQQQGSVIVLVGTSITTGTLLIKNQYWYQQGPVIASARISTDIRRKQKEFQQKSLMASVTMLVQNVLPQMSFHKKSFHITSFSTKSLFYKTRVETKCPPSQNILLYKTSNLLNVLLYKTSFSTKRPSLKNFHGYNTSFTILF
jgi:hypothetical protein